MTDNGLTIADAAEHTGLTAHTLRYYERSGVLPTPARTPWDVPALMMI